MRRSKFKVVVLTVTKFSTWILTSSQMYFTKLQLETPISCTILYVFYHFFLLWIDLFGPLTHLKWTRIYGCACCKYGYLLCTFFRINQLSLKFHCFSSTLTRFSINYTGTEECLKMEWGPVFNNSWFYWHQSFKFSNFWTLLELHLYSICYDWC